MDVGFDNNALTQKATVYYYADPSDENVDTRGAYWYYFEGENSTKAEPMPYCLTIKYYLPGNSISAYWVDYVPATPKEPREQKVDAAASSRYGKIEPKKVVSEETAE